MHAWRTLAQRKTLFVGHHVQAVTEAPVVVKWRAGAQQFLHGMATLYMPISDKRDKQEKARNPNTTTATIWNKTIGFVVPVAPK